MDRHYDERRQKSSENGFLIAILCVGVTLITVGTFLAIGVLFP